MSFQALFKGWTGELKTKFSQTLFLNSQYHVFNSVIIQTDLRSTQIDHVIISKYGIFVVETKNRSGWIFGSEDNDQWTVSLYGKKVRFQNPLRQNYLHTKCLADFLAVDHRKLHSLVVFWGDCEFKTQMPENVVKGLKCVSYIRSKKQVLFTDDEVDKLCVRLKELKDNTSFMSGWRHTNSVKKRYESTSLCPKCGHKLVERTAYRGTSVQHKFLGCENFPYCRYTKELT
jgi:hypothetical protein